MGANQMWAFLRGFSNQKFYEAIQQGTLTGAAPFTFGAIFAAETYPPATVQTVFGNSAVVGTGFSLGNSVAVAAWNGTAVQGTGPIDAAGAPLVPATDPATTEALANAYKSSALMGQAQAGSRSSNTVKSAQLVSVAMVVPAAGSQVLYINGHEVSVVPVGLATNANPITIGANSSHLLPASQIWLAGCFYHNASYSHAEMAAMQAACVTHKDLTGPSKFINAVDPTYMWSVKRGNYDARAAWVSDGSALNPITMVRNGVWPGTGVAGNLLAADVPWMSV